MREKAVRWEAIDDFPEAAIEDFEIASSRQGELSVVLHLLRSDTAPRDLHIRFSEAGCFRTFWDGDGSFAYADEPPRLRSNQVFYWPLLIITASQWLQSAELSTSVAMAEAARQTPWTNYRILSLERSLDVIARGEIDVAWSAVR